MRLAISHYTATSAAGTGLAALRESLKSNLSGLQRNNLDGCDIDTWIGRVSKVESVALPADLQHLQSRNNQLAWLGLQQDDLLGAISQLAERVGSDRIGVVMGSVAGEQRERCEPFLILREMRKGVGV